MSRTFTVAQIKEQIRQRADMERTNYIEDDELLSYINGSLAAFWDILVNVAEGFALNSIAFNATTTSDTYQLPASLLRIEKVELELNGVWKTLDSVPYARINEVSTVNASRSMPFLYARKGLYQIVLRPAPTGTHPCRLSYVERAPILSSDDDIIDGINGWEQYIVVDCAIKCKDKEETSTVVLQAERDDMIKRLKESMAFRDESTTYGIRDINERELSHNFDGFWE